MIDPNTPDWSFIIQDDLQLQSYLDAGFTEQVFVDAYETVIDYAMSAYKNKYVVTAVGLLPKELAQDQFGAVHDVLDYAFGKYGDRLIIAKGSLNAATPLAADSQGTPWETMAKYSPHAAAQYVWNVTNDPDFKMNGHTSYTDKLLIFGQAAEVAKSYNLIWIEPWRVDLLNPDLQDEVKNISELMKTN